MSHDINSQQSFDALPLTPTVREKTWVRTLESHPIRQSSSMNRLADFVGGAFRNAPL
jgi:hypothetical protein